MGATTQLIVSALAFSAIYACIAVGFNLIFAASRVAQFGAGHLAVVGGVVFSTMSARGNGLLALLAAAVAGAIFGAAVYLLIIRVGARRGATDIALSIAALAIGLLLDALVGVWTRNLPQVAPPLLGGHMEVAGARVAFYPLLVIAIVVTLLIAVHTFVYRTLLGKAMLAVSFNPRVATVSGINTTAVILAAWIVASVLITTGGALLTPLSVISRGVALPLALKGFAASIIGGLGSLNGAIIGAVLVGFGEAFFARYGSSGYVDVFLFSLLFLLLVARPAGVLGAAVVRKA